jgi:hypothetical protein
VTVITGGFGTIVVDSSVSVGTKAVVDEVGLVTIGVTGITASVCVGVISHVALGDGDAEGLAIGGGNGLDAPDFPLLDR